MSIRFADRVATRCPTFQAALKVREEMERVVNGNAQSNAGAHHRTDIDRYFEPSQHAKDYSLEYPSFVMNVTQPWNIVFLIGFIIFVGIRAKYARAAKVERTAVSRFDGLERFLLALMFPPTMLLPLIYLFSPLLSFADYVLPDFVSCIGATAMVMSLWLFWRSHADLGRYWSVSLEVREGHALVTGGVYRVIRHPMYASIWLWAFAQGMLLANWLAGWSVVPAFAAMYFLRVAREEDLMCESFGDEYQDYMRQTGRVFPRLKRKRSPS